VAVEASVEEMVAVASVIDEGLRRPVAPCQGH
jgi:hypothetical protein